MCLEQASEVSPKTFGKPKIIKNMVVLCATFFATFLAYDCLSMLQSTLNREGGIGVVCQAVVYGSYCISSLLLPKYVIKKFGCKKILVWCMFLYVPYIASNLYPHWAVMVPAAFLNGLAASPLWGAQCQYLNKMAEMYAALGKPGAEKNYDHHPNATDSNNKKSLDSGVKGNADESFSAIRADPTENLSDKPSTDIANTNDKILQISGSDHEASTVVAKINAENPQISKSNPDEVCHRTGKEKASSFESRKGKEDNRKCKSPAEKSRSHPIFYEKGSVCSEDVQSVTARFFGLHGMAYLSTHMLSNLMSYFILNNGITPVLNTTCVCGANFCNEESDCFVHNLQDTGTGNRNLLIGLCTGLAPVAILLMAVLLDPIGDEQKEDVYFSTDFLLATCRHLKTKNQIFLTPVSFYVGMIQGFYVGDFNMSFVGCAWGTFHVGLVGACYGAACAVSSSLSGCVIKYVGRAPVILFSAILNVACQILLLLWKPSADEPAIFLLVAALWGTSVGIFWSQVKAIYGFLFKNDEEVAFAAYHLWYSLGFCLSFAYSNHFCTCVKIYVLMFVLIFGVVGYVCVEWFLNKK